MVFQHCKLSNAGDKVSRQIFRYQDVPAEMTVLDYIRSNSDWDEFENRFKGRFEPELRISVPVDTSCLRREIATAYCDMGWHYWRSTIGNSYSGMAITHNPTLGDDERFSGLLGHERYRDMDVADYFAVDRHQDNQFRVRDDYLDTLGFRHLNDFSNYPELLALFQGFQRPISRSRIATLFGVSDPSSDDVGWHVDEPPTTLLRVNICIEANDDFSLQYKSGETEVLKPGESSIVNTDHQHRVAVHHTSISSRTHIVVGVLPWLDYDPSEDAWAFSEFYGQIHPYDMVREGLIYANV